MDAASSSRSNYPAAAVNLSYQELTALNNATYKRIGGVFFEGLGEK